MQTSAPFPAGRAGIEGEGGHPTCSPPSEVFAGTPERAAGSFPSPAHLVDVDGDVDDDVQQVAQGQAGDEDVGAVPHALVLVDDPQERGVADDAQDEDQAGHHRVDVLESLLDLCLPRAHGGRGRAGPPAAHPPKTLGQRGRPGGVGRHGGPGRQRGGLGGPRRALQAGTRGSQGSVALGGGGGAAAEQQQQQEGGGHGAARPDPRRAVSSDLRGGERGRGVSSGEGKIRGGWSPPSVPSPGGCRRPAPERRLGRESPVGGGGTPLRSPSAPHPRASPSRASPSLPPRPPPAGLWLPSEGNALRRLLPAPAGCRRDGRPGPRPEGRKEGGRE